MPVGILEHVSKLQVERRLAGPEGRDVVLATQQDIDQGANGRWVALIDRRIVPRPDDEERDGCHSNQRGEHATTKKLGERMSFAAAIDVASADRYREISVAGTEHQQDCARNYEQRDKMQRPRQAGEVGGKKRPSCIRIFSRAIRRPENDDAEQERDRVDLCLGRVEPDCRHESSGETSRRCRQSVLRPAGEEVGENSAGKGCGTRRKQVDRSRKAEHRREHHAPDLADQDVERSSRRMWDAKRMNGSEELPRIPERYTRGQGEHVHEQ